ncbi:hypothetical protein EXU85_05980 [Spirosoma sp. KCTC 42546]|uniref:hypothetical protein n=1 Tax=Spirosoma sp. KCTC 42546 TaxID=2520506 RepID=UPI00115BD32B|nr:hypothetical protein [Spirosoma sp. KCTC 42546]QDK78168.1 hypothetical protein EXU85_05980 [Spirosoma sp. KCTC 42546]
MEATFVLDAQEDRLQFAERLTSFFAGKTIRVRVEEVASEAVEQQSLLKRMEALRLLTEQVPVTLQPGMDINDLIDEVNE